MLEHLWCWDKPQATLDSQDSPWPRLRGSHHLPPYSILCTSPWGSHPNDFLSRDSQRGVPKLPKLEFSELCEAITSCSYFRSGRGLKQSCSSRWDLSTGMLHVTCTHRIRVNSRLFVVGSQTTSLTPSLSFCHNLCYRCPNGSCKPFLDIYTSITFWWYKELFNARCFYPWNHSLKVQESTGALTPKMGAHLEVWVFHSHTLSHSS